MPDTRTKSDHNQIFKSFSVIEATHAWSYQDSHYLKTCSTALVALFIINPKLAAQKMTVPQPYIIALGTVDNVESTFLVVEKQIHCQITPKEIAVTLLSAFWAFSMEYTPGCCNILPHVALDANYNQVKSVWWVLLSILPPGFHNETC